MPPLGLDGGLEKTTWGREEGEYLTWVSNDWQEFKWQGKWKQGVLGSGDIASTVPGDKAQNLTGSDILVNILIFTLSLYKPSMLLYMRSLPIAFYMLW